MFLDLWKAIDNTALLALSFLLWTDEYLLHTVLDWKVIDPQATTSSYVAKNIELNQEFYFASSETKMTINNMFNSSWLGSVMYD